MRLPTQSLAAPTVRPTDIDGPALATAQALHSSARLPPQTPLSQSLDPHSPIRQTRIPRDENGQVIYSRTHSPLHDLAYYGSEKLTQARREVSDTARAAPGAALHTWNNMLDLANSIGKTGKSLGTAGTDWIHAQATAATLNAAGISHIDNLRNAHHLSLTQTPDGRRKVAVKENLDSTGAAAEQMHALTAGASALLKHPGSTVARYIGDFVHRFDEAQTLRESGQTVAARQIELEQLFDAGAHLIPILGGAYGVGRLVQWVGKQVKNPNTPALSDRRARFVAQVNSRLMPARLGGGTPLPEAVMQNHVPSAFEAIRTGIMTVGAGSIAGSAANNELKVYVNTDMAYRLFNASDAAFNVSFVFGDLKASLWFAPFNIRPPLLSGIDNHSNPYLFRDKKGFGYVDIPILGTELGAGWRQGESDYAVGTRYVLRPANVQLPLSFEHTEKHGTTRALKLIGRIGVSPLHAGVYPTVFVGPANYGFRQTASMSQLIGRVQAARLTGGKKFENRNSHQDVYSINPAFGYGDIEAGKTPDFVWSLR